MRHEFSQSAGLDSQLTGWLSSLIVVYVFFTVSLCNLSSFFLLNLMAKITSPHQVFLSFFTTQYTRLQLRVENIC